MQANITRINRTCYSDLNLVFPSEVSGGDGENSDPLCDRQSPLYDSPQLAEMRNAEFTFSSEVLSY